MQNSNQKNLESGRVVYMKELISKKMQNFNIRLALMFGDMVFEMTRSLIKSILN